MPRARCSCRRRRLWYTSMARCRRLGMAKSPTRQYRPTWLMSYVAVSLGGYSGGPMFRSSAGHWQSRGFQEVLHVRETLRHGHFVSLQMHVTSCMEYSWCSQQPATCPYPEPDKSSPRPHPTSWDPFSYCPLIYVQVFQVVPFIKISYQNSLCIYLLCRANFRIFCRSRFSEIKLWPWQCVSQA